MEKGKIIRVAAMATWVHVNKSEGSGNDSMEVTRDEEYGRENSNIYLKP